MYFSQMEKQSNADGFCHAVDCGLDEVSRRVELGLSCSCLPQEMHDKIKFQDVASAGIREESSRIVGGDNLSSASSFLPGEFVQFLGSLAESSLSKTDRLQFVIKRAQLLAFNRWKGRYQLPVFEEFGELEDDNQSNVKRKGKDSPGSEGTDSIPSKKRKLTALGGSSRKRKHMSGDEECPKIKEKCISVLMSSSSSSLQNDENKPLKETGRMAVSSRKNHETMRSDPQVKTRNRLLSPSSSGDMALQGKTNLRVRKSLPDSAKKSQLVEIVPAGIPTPDVILSELMLAAKNPLQRNDTMISVAGLLREIRNSTYIEKSCSENATKDKGKQPSSLETNDAFGFEGTKDSYWTDRIIQSYPQDQVLFEPETPNECASELAANINVPLNLDSNRESDASIMDLDQSFVMNDVSGEYSPTALILNFTNLESIPSVTNLNEIFSRYGPLIEAETKILSKSKRAKVIFRR
ncbi:hypothetical protein CDL12_22379 [Handroanthus impetiginosus]|uniref:Uncharacterized protein n=1 Tax=Handroanthus impetiginosus TaxID=429701 RepID=A0A2G9GIG5_9LAMI|nr:hypothetical protein CDL12_22379 [Handroanthus impetiginosus]